MNYISIASLQDAVYNEKIRYHFKGGINLFLAFIQSFAFFYYGPDCVQYLWKHLITLGEWKVLFSVVTLVMPIITFFVVNGVYSIIYYIKHPFFERYKVLNQPWPWEKTQEEWIQWRDRLIYFSFLNLVVFNSLFIALELFLGVDHYNHSSDKLPSKFEYLWQIVFFMICDDFFFYFSHRLFHWKPLYRFHKIHHEHNNSTSFSNLQVHPVDYIFTNVISVVSGYHILGSRVHYTSYILWNIWRIMETCDGHCGYEFPWSMFRLIPFSGSSDFHNFHHSKNSGNYSSFFTYWDTLLGTNKDYLKQKEQQHKKVNNILMNQYLNEQLQLKRNRIKVNKEYQKSKYSENIS